ncbi:MAG: hypothetical protein QW727_01305 [Candidatus Pacearchaeota archaeon]
MDKAKENFLLNFIAFFMAVFLITIIVSIIYYKNYSSIFWLCYTGIAIILIGILKRNSSLILSQVIILAIPDFLWGIDFFSIVISGDSLLNLARGFFIEERFLKKFVAIQHLFTIPLSIYSLYILKVKSSWKVLVFSFVQLEIFFWLTKYFALERANINCVYYSCANIGWGADIYPLAWIVTMFGFSLLVYFIIKNIKFFKKQS